MITKKNLRRLVSKIYETKFECWNEPKFTSTPWMPESRIASLHTLVPTWILLLYSFFGDERSIIAIDGTMVEGRDRKLAGNARNLAVRFGRASKVSPSSWLRIPGWHAWPMRTRHVLTSSNVHVLVTCPTRPSRHVPRRVSVCYGFSRRFVLLTANFCQPSKRLVTFPILLATASREYTPTCWAEESACETLYDYRNDGKNWKYIRTCFVIEFGFCVGIESNLELSLQYSNAPFKFQ